MEMIERTVAMQRVYEGRIVALELHDVELPNGVRAKREVVRHGPAVAVVAACADGRFAFVRQFRKPVERTMWEVVAGNVEAGEDLAAAAAREVREETGYETLRLERLGAIYPSPGYVDERIEIFYAELAPSPVGKALDEDEHVELQLHTKAEVLAMMRSGEVQDAKTLAAWLLYEQLVQEGRGKEQTT